MPQAKLISIDKVSGTLYKLSFEPVDKFDFKAGQFLIFPLPPEPGAAEGSKAPKGFYSIASSEQAYTFELLFEHREGGGYVSGYMTSQEPGALLSFDGPMGKFGLFEGSALTQAFLATPAGLAPLRSMLLSLLGSGSQQGSYLFIKDPLFADEFRALERKHPHFHYVPGPDPCGSLIKNLKSPSLSQVYTAGFNKDLEPWVAQLTRAGLPPRNLKAEKFG